MNISPIGTDITLRFFKALDAVIDTRELRGVKTFTDKYNINRRNFMFVKQHPTTSVLKPEWIAYLCDFNVSADYIVLGKGGIFSETAK